MTDIVERLRGGVDLNTISEITEEAADEIERLREQRDKYCKAKDAEIQRLRALLDKAECAIGKRVT